MSSNTQLLDSDLVNEWSELLINEQELAASSAHLTHHHHSHHTRQSHIQHQKQILEKGCFIPPNLSSSCIKQQKHLSASSPVENGIPSTPPPSCTPNHLHSNNHSATLNNESLDSLKSKETIVHKSIRPAPAIPPYARKKYEEESSEGSPIITKQPLPRPGSVSRGLQVEEEDLIKFSEPDMQFNLGHKSHSEDYSKIVHHRSSLNSGGKRRPPGQPDIPSHNDNSKCISTNNNPLSTKEVNEKKKLNGIIGAKEDESIGDEDGMMDELNHPNDDEGDTISNRTADEQIDYLESLEPCPCYAKCCLDSIITLFCVTLLG
nr:uncharacterized protein LOC121122875 [Lepeophtheirus salmonis]